MSDIEKVIKAIETHISTDDSVGCDNCTYENDGWCMTKVMADALELLKEQQEEHKRMISWLSKFCRHIDNGDKWLTDEENLEFFREKMKQQFGWSDT